jgi:F0F1-type ATP synthase membrane subunit b/b'
VSTPDQPVPNTGLKAKARRVAAPVMAKARQEIVRAAADDQQALRAEVAELRTDLARQAASHAAEIAALREEVAGLVAGRRR